MNLADRQRAVRDGLNGQRRAATASLIEMQTQRAALTAETSRVEAAVGPVRYIAIMLGTDAETVVRWLILLMVLCCDPAAIALTIAVAGARSPQVKCQREPRHAHFLPVGVQICKIWSKRKLLFVTPR